MDIDRTSRQRPVRVAIVGTGLAGLSTVYFLSTLDAVREQAEAEELLDIEVHLLDRSDSIGMDTASLSIKSEDGEAASYRVDVPMRSINGGSHGRVRRLYQHLGVPLVKSDFSYSFSRLARIAVSRTGRRRASRSAVGGEVGEVSDEDQQSPMDEEESATEDDLLSDGSTRTPPPSYTEAESCADSSSPTANRAEPNVCDSKSSSPLRLDRPETTTSLLYQGASGLRWPPVSLPSHLSRASLRARLVYVAQTTVLAVSYLYLLLLAFVYVSLGLARPRSAATSLQNTGRSPLVRRAWEATGLADWLNIAATPLGEFCLRHRLPQRLVEGVLIPLMAAVATVGIDEAREMPTGEVLDYIVDTFAHSHHVTCPSVGVRGIVRRLMAPVPPAQIHLGADIVRIERSSSTAAGASSCYRLVYRSNSQGQQEQAELEVDHVIFATQADQAARLVSTLGIEDSSVQETVEALEAFTYVRTLVVTHRDKSVLPLALDDRRDLNLAVFESSRTDDRISDDAGAVASWDESLGYLPPSSVQTTHVLSSRSRTGSSPVLQTTNPIIPIDPDRVLASTWFSRAFATAKSQAVLGRFLLPSSSSSSESSTSPAPSSASLQGRALGSSAALQSTNKETTSGGIWFVGSYVATGFPLLEGCVSSAEAVVRELVRREGGQVRRWAY